MHLQRISVAVYAVRTNIRPQYITWTEMRLDPAQSCRVDIRRTSQSGLRI